jgi:hypothetical protein
VYVRFIFSGSDPEKCVTAEAFAHFASAATWWTQGATSPLYRGERLEGNYPGDTGDACVSIAATPHRRRGNAARYFWDLYDSTTVGTDDAAEDDEIRSYADIANVWTSFPNGTGDRQKQESGAHGRNVKDFGAYTPWATEVERDHNCLGAQETN